MKCPIHSSLMQNLSHFKNHLILNIHTTNSKSTQSKKLFLFKTISLTINKNHLLKKYKPLHKTNHKPKFLLNPNQLIHNPNQLILNPNQLILNPKYNNPNPKYNNLNPYKKLKSHKFNHFKQLRQMNKNHNNHMATNSKKSNPPKPKILNLTKTKKIKRKDDTFIFIFSQMFWYVVFMFDLVSFVNLILNFLIG